MQPQRYFNPKGPHRVAMVSVEPAFQQAGAFLVRVGRGAKFGSLSGGQSFGPYAEADVAAAIHEAVAQLRSEGFRPAGEHGSLEALVSQDPARRARAALRLGWQRATSAVDLLLHALSSCTTEACSIIDGLGEIGDARAIPALREYAARKLLSRRRSAVEALRKLDDNEGLLQARARAVEQLPPTVREALIAVADDSRDAGDISRLLAAVNGCEAKLHGLILDTLYEWATPAAVAVVERKLATMKFDQAFVWRYVKSIHKRAMLRHDFRMLGWLTYVIERQGEQTVGTSAAVKSGLDGESRTTRIFSRKTQAFMRRATWRHFRKLAKHRPEDYPHAAAEAIVHYNDKDALIAGGLYPPFAHCYLLHRVLFSSERFKLSPHSLRFRLKQAGPWKRADGKSEAAFADLWDAQPRALLRLLSAARLTDVHEWALPQVKARHMSVVESCDAATLLGMMRAPYAGTVQLASNEFERRFDPANPDWDLITGLANSDATQVQALGHRLLRTTADRWAREANRTVTLLTSPQPATRAIAAELAAGVLAGDPAARAALAPMLLSLLRAARRSASGDSPLNGASQAPQTPEQAEQDALRGDGLEGVAQVCAALKAELLPLATVEELFAMIDQGSISAQAVAGELLGAKPGAAEALGLQRLVLLTQHSMATVRQAGGALLRNSPQYWRGDPSVLFTMTESEWADTRFAALELLRSQFDYSGPMGFEALVGLLDSNRIDVQNAGREIVTAQFARLDIKRLLERLVQHPHPNMRRFAVQLALDHLPVGAGALTQAAPMCRAALFDLWPSRQEKARVVELLVKRGIDDADQAAIAARLLGDVVRTQGRRDFENALEGLVRLKLAWPHLSSPVSVAASQEAPVIAAGGGA